MLLLTLSEKVSSYYHNVALKQQISGSIKIIALHILTIIHTSETGLESYVQVILV